MNENAQILITKNTFPEDIETNKFIDQNINLIKSQEGYKEIHIDKTSISGKKTHLHRFELNNKKYIQTYITDKNIAYLITGITTPDSPKEIDQEIIKTIKSFRLNKKP